MVQDDRVNWEDVDRAKSLRDKVLGHPAYEPGALVTTNIDTTDRDELARHLAELRAMAAGLGIEE